MSGRLAQVEAEAQMLRQMVERQDFAGAQQAVERYVALLAVGLRGGNPGQAAQRLSEALELIEWARRNLRAARTSLADQESHLQQLSSYSAPQRAQSHMCFMG